MAPEAPKLGTMVSRTFAFTFEPTPSAVRKAEDEFCVIDAVSEATADVQFRGLAPEMGEEARDLMIAG